jgi:hypothetical protein
LRLFRHAAQHFIDFFEVLGFGEDLAAGKLFEGDVAPPRTSACLMYCCSAASRKRLRAERFCVRLLGS